MGLFLRKSLSCGPVRFNLSKSGIGMSTGIKGARIGVGPRGTYVSGGSQGIQFRKYLSTTSAVSAPRSSTSRNLVPTSIPQPHKTAKAPEGAAPPASASPFLGIFLIALGSCIFLASGAIAVVVAALFGAAGVAAIVMTQKQNRSKQEYERLLLQLSIVPDSPLLDHVTAARERVAGEWYARHRFIYRGLVESVVGHGISPEQSQWQNAVAVALAMQPAVRGIHTDVVRNFLWEVMADDVVTEEEESLVFRALETLNVSSDQISAEWEAFRQYIRGRALKDGMPEIDPQIPMQRGEICHHITHGAFLESKIVRTHTVNGRAVKDEELRPMKTGDIYITSKRVLLVGDGTSSIPHDKILDVEINHDDGVVTIVKDGRQKPLHLQVSDVIFCGMLIDHLGKHGE